MIRGEVCRIAEIGCVRMQEQERDWFLHKNVFQMLSV